MSNAVFDANIFGNSDDVWIDAPIHYHEHTPKKRQHSVKVVIIGGENTGKTTIAQGMNGFECFDDSVCSFYGSNSGKSHLNGNFSQTFIADMIKRCISSKAIFDTLPKAMRPMYGKDDDNDDNDDINLTLWDTAGYERHEILPPSMLLNGCHVVIMCFSVGDISSVKKIIPLMEHCMRSKVAENCVFMVLGTKIDIYSELYAKMISDTIKAIKINNNSTDRHGERVGPSPTSTLLGYARKEDIKYSPTGLTHLIGEECFTRANKSFFSLIFNDISKIRTKLFDMNDATSRALFAYTSFFCKAACEHNPIYCIMYAVALHMKKRLARTKENEQVFQSSSSSFSGPSTTRERTAVGIITTSKNNNGREGIIKLSERYNDDDEKEKQDQTCC